MLIITTAPNNHFRYPLLAFYPSKHCQCPAEAPGTCSPNRVQNFVHVLASFWPHIRWKPYILVGSAGSVRAALAGEPAVGNWSCGAARERLQRISLFSCPGSTSRPPPVIFGASGDRADRTGSAGSMWASLSRQWPSAAWSGRRGRWWFFFVWFLNWAEMETVTVL